jgi:hypothetical protein
VVAVIGAVIFVLGSFIVLTTMHLWPHRCPAKGCAQTFDSMDELYRHIEDAHFYE